jgi:hypothetical protein
LAANGLIGINSLERHAPERFEAVRQRYTAQIAVVDEQIATLQPAHE